MEVFIVNAIIEYEGDDHVAVADSFELAKRLAVDHAAEHVHAFYQCPAPPMLAELATVVLGEWRDNGPGTDGEPAYWASSGGSECYSWYVIQRCTVQHHETQGIPGA